MIWLSLAVAALAQGEPATEAWYLGRNVQEVAIRSPTGTLAEADDFNALLETQVGELYNPYRVGYDITTLFRSGQFASVEAIVSPCYDPVAGDGVGACIAYLVTPSPQVVRINVQGVRGDLAREIRAASRITPGSSFFWNRDADDSQPMDDDRLRERILDFLDSRGYANAIVEVDVVVLDPSAKSVLPRLFRRNAPQGPPIELWIRVQTGVPRTLSSVGFVTASGDKLPIAQSTLRGWARKAGLVDGKPLSQEALTRARLTLRDNLASLNRSGWFNTHAARGWLDNRIEVDSVTTDDSVKVMFTIDFGARTKLEIRGDGRLTKRRQAIEGLGLNERTRITRVWAREAQIQLIQYLQERGFYRAEATVNVTNSSDEPEVRTIRVDMARGDRHERTHTRFEGNTVLSKNELRQVLRQASPDVLRRGYVSQRALDKALRAVLAVYASRGYLNARISGEPLVLRNVRKTPMSERPTQGTDPTRPNVYDRMVQFVLDCQTFGIRLALEEGLPNRVHETRLTGVPEGADLTDLQSAIDELEGLPYSPQRVEMLSRIAVGELRRAGWLDADATIQVTDIGQGIPGEITNQFDIEIRIDAGDPIRLRAIIVKGNRRISNAYVRDVVALPVGAPLTTEVLELVRRKLYDTSMFRVASLDVTGEGAARDLEINLQEQPRYRFEFGFGANSDQGFRAFLRPTLRNVILRRTRADGVVSIGYNWASDSFASWRVDWRRPDWRAGLTVTAPRFFLPQQDLQVEFVGREEVRQARWDLLATGGGTRLNLRFGPHWKLQLLFRAEARRLVDVDPGLVIPGEPWFGLVDLDAGETRSEFRYQDTLGFTLIADTRDDPVTPTRGVAMNLTTEVGPNALQFVLDEPDARYSYVRGEFRLSAFVPLRRTSLRFLLQGRHIRTTSKTKRNGVEVRHSVPLEDRFFLGGNGSMRGFSRDSIGPRNLVSVQDVGWSGALRPTIEQALRDEDTAQRWVSVGGDTQALAVAEWQIPVSVIPQLSTWDGYALALFADVGNVWLVQGAEGIASLDGERLLDPNIPRVGLGTGLRVATAIGPLQIDVATDPAWLFGSRALRNELREWGEKGYRIHLALGAVF